MFKADASIINLRTLNKDLTNPNINDRFHTHKKGPSQGDP